jgi:2-methylisocitrate lyase-like PEP mutase family enzyme
MGTALSVAEFAELGVRRISIGGALARVGWGAVIKAAEQLLAGSFSDFAGAASGKNLNEVFGSFA